MAATSCPAGRSCFEARQRYRERDDLLLLFSTYWSLGKKARKMPDMFQQTDMGHACEWETSMILRLTPHLVGKIDKLEDVARTFPYDPVYQGWITKDRTVKGHIGVPRHATAEKGEWLFDNFANDVVAFLKTVVSAE